MKITNAYALILGSALTLVGSSALAATIVNSKHDLSNASTSGGNKVTGTAALGTGTDETCVFCHTPHAAASNTVPLWNKNIGTTAGFATDGATALTTYSSSTVDGTTTFVGSTSMACLSCHDGTQAMDNLVNVPGSGTVALGATNDGMAYTWSSPGGTMDTTTGKLNGGIALLGANLGDDHPVAIEYAGGGLLTGGTAADFTDPDFNLPTEDVDGLGNERWWFDAVAQGGDNDGNMDASEIRLYTRGGSPYVECASCHDPHNGNAAGEDNVFLRMANTSSAVCTACHNK